MNTIFLSILSNIGIYLSVFIGVIYLLKYKQHDYNFKLFSVYLLFIGIIQISSYIIVSIFNKHNLFLSHFYFIIQFILLSLLYYRLLQYKIIKIVTAIGLTLFAIQYIINPKLFFGFNALGMAISHFILVCYTVLYLFKMIDKNSDFMIINIGLFIYLLSSTLIFASSSMFLKFSYSMILFDMNKILYVIFQLVLLYVWFFKIRKHKRFTF